MESLRTSGSLTEVNGPRGLGEALASLSGTPCDVA